MKRLTTLLLLFPTLALAQNKRKIFHGMYLQWGYNKEWYSNSSIHFKMANGDRFILHAAKAHDKPDYDAIIKEPAQVSVPQYNYRIGFYTNSKRTQSIEINFDHIKYVVTDGQKVRVSGTINGVTADGDSILTAENFLHLEHTDGGNLLHINYVQQNTLFKTRSGKRQLVTLLWKAGAGINIPRTDFTWKGDRLNNKFHVAGYNISAEAGARLYASSRLFIEFTGKSGFVKYVNALANTTQTSGNRVKHSFGYFELIATVGYDIHF